MEKSTHDTVVEKTDVGKTHQHKEYSVSLEVSPSADSGKTLEVPPSEEPEEQKQFPSFVPSVNQAADAAVIAAEKKETNPNPQGLLVPEPLSPALYQDVTTLLNSVGSRGDVASALGLSDQFTAVHERDLTRISLALIRRNRSEHWLSRLVHWAKAGKDREANFWKAKLQTGSKAVAKLAEFLETGTIAEQFDARLHAEKPNCLAMEYGKRNDLLFYDGTWTANPEPKAEFVPVGGGFDEEES